MILLQVITSVSSMVGQNCIQNRACKKDLPTSSHVYRFNAVAYLVCIVAFAFVAIRGGISLYTVLGGVLFGVVTALTNYFKMLALSSGPMHITLLITNASMLIPTVSGVFFGERFSLLQLGVVFLLLFFIYLSLGRGSTCVTDRRWLLWCVATFLFQGSIGVLQKLHQSSSHKGEIGSFLLVSFICSLIYSLLRSKGSMRELNFTKRLVFFALLSGACTFTMNYLNLKLSGLLPSRLFFPIVNGSSIVICSILSVLLFRERLTGKQMVGLAGGIASLVLICLLK